MGTVLIKAGIFLCMILLGILLRRVGFFQKDDFSLIAKIVINITLPCAVITNFAGMELDFSLLILSAFGLGCNLLLMGAGVLAARGKSKLDRAYNIVNYTGFNIGCFSMPYIQSFLGASGAVAEGRLRLRRRGVAVDVHHRGRVRRSAIGAPGVRPAVQ